MSVRVGEGVVDLAPDAPSKDRIDANVRDFGSSRHAAIGSVSVPFGERLKTPNIE